MQFPLLYRDAEDKIYFRFISSHLIWSQTGHLNLTILHAQTCWLVEASASEHHIDAMGLGWMPHVPPVTDQGEVLLPS